MSETGGAEDPVVELRAALAVRDELIGALRAEIAELRARLDANSGNSSKPPSSDSPFEGPAPRSLRRKSGRKPGGQPGREGKTLRQVPNPDHVRVHEPSCCRGCGAGLDGAPETSRVVRQSFDLPPVRVEVTEDQLVERECACGARTRADAPEGVTAPVQYGPRIATIIVYLYVGQFLSKKRTATALSELFAVPVCEGTVAAVTARAAAGCDDFLALVRERLRAEPVVNFDETGLRVQNKLRWVHSASTAKYSLVGVHDKRGVEGMDALGILPGFTGIAVHDAWAPYDTYNNAIHALCNAHVLRELQAVTDAAVEGQWCWATQTADALGELKALADTALDRTGNLAEIDPHALRETLHRYRSAVRIGAKKTAGRATKLERKHNALANRLIDRQTDYLRFLHDPRVPFDNNGAERNVRMVKLRQKVSGCLRTLTGAEQFTAIRSYTATAIKQDVGVFYALSELIAGRPSLPA